MKSWLTSRKFGIVVLFCVFLVVGLYFLWTTLGMKEGLYITIPDNTTATLNKVVDQGDLADLNDTPNPNAPMSFSDTAPVARNTGADPEFPLVGSIMKCAVDDINGNGTYYMVGSTDPKTINPFPNSDPGVINTWSDTWATAPSFNNCTAFQRGPTMDRQTPLPDVGRDVNCQDEDGKANQHTYRVITNNNNIKKIKPFPGYEEDPDQVVAKSWGVSADKVNIENCKNISKPIDANGTPIQFKYKLDKGSLEGKLVKCLQTAPGSSENRLGYHNRNTSIYKVENGYLRWFQSRDNAYTEVDNFNSWNYPLTEKVIGVPSCDDFLIGENIAYNGDISRLPEGTYTKCSVDVLAPNGAGVGQVYKVVNRELSWTVSEEIASFLDPSFSSISRSIPYYKDCSHFTRGPDITRLPGAQYYNDYYSTPQRTYTINLPDGCRGIYAITLGGGGGGGGGCGGWTGNGEGGGGAGGGGGTGGIVKAHVGYKIPINDNNRTSTFTVYVGSGGTGGTKGDYKYNYMYRSGNNTDGNDGEDSYISVGTSNTPPTYFRAGGGKGGKKGVWTKHYRGASGEGGAGGTSDENSSNYDIYPGANGGTKPIVTYDEQRPDTNIEGGDGGDNKDNVNIPAEIKGKIVTDQIVLGNGGKGGRGSSRHGDYALPGEDGKPGFVRVYFLF